MDRYVYLVLAAYYACFWLVIWVRRPDLHSRLVWAGVAGGVGSLVSEYWYARDYWHVPYLVGRGTYSLDDFLFGFFIAGVAASLYAVVFDRMQRRNRFNPFRMSLTFPLGLALACFLAGYYVAGFSSTTASVVAMILLWLILIVRRPAMCKSSILNALLLMLLLAPLYLMVFGLLVPGWWERQLIADGAWGMVWLGIFPIGELVWCVAFGLIAGLACEVAEES